MKQEENSGAVSIIFEELSKTQISQNKTKTVRVEKCEYERDSVIEIFVLFTINMQHATPAI